MRFTLQHNKFTCKIAPVPNNVKKIRFQLFCYFLLLACLSGQPASAEETWLLVDTNNIRDVLLFPHMRPEQSDRQDQPEGGTT